MTDDEHDNFTVGTVVTWLEWSPRRTVRGHISRVTPNRVTARPDCDGKAKTFHRRTGVHAFECCRVDVARERWHRELGAWWETRPPTVLLDLTQCDQGAEAWMRIDGAVIGARVSLESLDQIADEAHAIREWLRKRPVEPKP